MAISANYPVGNSVQGLDTTPAVNTVRDEREDTPDRRATQNEENPDYRISLSDDSKKALAELSGPPEPGEDSQDAELSEENAGQVAQKVSTQLAQTNIAISNQAIAKAVDLFT